MPATATNRFEPQTRVAGRFRLRKRLATGGMGEVWVARNESTGADVALKVLRRSDAATAREIEIEERFRHEARLSAMLSHRSIVKVFDLLEEPDGTLVLVMELLRGETLQAYLERKPPRPAIEAVAILLPVLSALAHAHERGIVHRDLTPANIFLAVDPDGHVTPKLVDFGIAKLMSGASSPVSSSKAIQTVDGRVLGTPRYMAPERIRGETEADGRMDLFAVGVVLYEIMTGVSPFAASTPAASLAAVLERHIDPDPRIEPRLWLEIQRALSKRPYERHASALEMATALHAVVGDNDGLLDAALRRTQPPPGSEEAQALGSPTDPPPEQRSIESVVVLPRKRVKSTVWLAAGGVVGVVLGLTVFGLRSLPVSRAPGAGASASAASTPESPPAMETAAASANATATTPSTATTPATTMATPTATAVGTRAAPLRPRPVRPRPVATTPGF
jgi:serine/threonine-protein kinase